MTQNELDIIRGGLANYIGAIQGAVDAKGLEKNQYVVSVMMDEILKIAQVDINSPYCDPFILVPVFNAVEGVLIQQIQVMQRGEQTEDIKHRIVRYQAMIEEFNHLIEKSMTQEAKYSQDSTASRGD